MNKKTVLLLCPYLFGKTGHLWQLLHIVKKGKLPDYSTEPITSYAIRQAFASKPEIFITTLHRFSEKNIEEIKREIKAIAKAKGAGQNATVWFTSSFEKKIHQDFMAMKPLLPLVSCYHRTPIEGDEKRLKTAACKFSNCTPELYFNVKKADNYFYIDIEVNVSGSYYPFDSFTQTSFLLESENEYFILRFADYKIISWLAQTNWKVEGADAALFSENILTRLEKDYTVRRNNLMEVNAVEEVPTGQVLLSEISGQFLMLTPQFKYGNFKVEGAFKPQQIVNAQGKEYTINRNKALELAIVSQIESLHKNFKKQLNGYFHLSYEEAKKKDWFLKAFRKLVATNIEVLGMDMLKQFRYCTTPAITALKIAKEEANNVQIIFSLHFGEEEVAFTDLQKIIRSGQQAILLKEGSIALLEEEWITKYALLVKHAFVDAGKIFLPKWLTIVLEKEEETGDVLRLVFKEEWWQKWHRWQAEETILYPLPASITASLRGYQQKGYEWLMLLNEAGVGMFLADDMGLGKTLQTICFIAALIEVSHTKKIIIICPASLLYNWQHELTKFAPSIKASVYHGANRDKAIFTDDDTQVIISSYGTLRTEEAFFISFLFAAIILDESHTIKNPSSQISKAVHKLRGQSRITLSGTPVMNNTLDLFSQLQFILPNLFISREFFKREYADPIDIDRNEARIKDLQKLTAPFILRRTKEQVAKDLPSKTEMLLWCQMEERQQQVYNEIKNRIKGELEATIKEQGLQKTKLQVLQGIIKLRQVCNSPVLLKDEDYTCTESIKTKELMGEIENNLSNHKALVFSQFTSMLDILSKELEKKNIPHLLLTGSTPPKERDKLVQQFNSIDSEHKVFLLSLKAGNAGLNLTAADYVFLFDPWWNSAVEQQAIDRTHRIGQTKNVFAYKLICRDTIEERIIQLQQRKKELAGDLVVEEDGFVKKLTEEDIGYLFG